MSDSTSGQRIDPSAARLCPQGHRTIRNVILPPGEGRFRCPTCGWADTDDFPGHAAGTESTDPVHPTGP